MNRLCLVAVLAFGGGAAPPVLSDENWPDWRGPRLDRTSRSTGLPERWSATEGVRWKAPLPAWAAATPIVWGECVFVLSPSARGAEGEGRVGRALPNSGRSDPGGPDLVLLCFSREDGRLRWQRRIDGDNALFGKHNMASPSPVTDGQRVYALTGSGALAALDFDGSVLWQRSLSDDYVPFQPYWGYGSSPLLHDGKLFVQVLHGSQGAGPSLLIALDAATGDEAWKIERRTDAIAECPDAYTTPTLLQAAGRTELVVSGADYVTGHDPQTGAEFWRAAGLNPSRQPNYRVCPSPVAYDGVIYAGSRKKPVLAVRGGGTGDVTQSHTIWKYEDKAGPDVPTPVTDGKRVYLVDDKGLVTALDAASGAVVWGPERTALGTVSASPLLADGKLYITNELGTTTVLRAGERFEKLAENELDGSYTLASPVAAGGQIFIRTAEYLYCIGRE